MMTDPGQRDAWAIVDGCGWSTPEGEPALSAVSFSLGDQRVGLVGANGSGKTTLLRILAGELAPTTGVARTTGRVGYLPQHADQCAAAARIGDLFGLGALENLTGSLEEHEASVGRVDGDYDWVAAERFRSLVHRFRLQALPAATPMRTLSGGELTKVMLTKLFWEDPDLLLLDEPTNNLDREARSVLYELLDGWEKGALIATHDRALLRRLERILHLDRRGIESYGGGYESYREQRALEEAAAHHQLRDAERELTRARRKIQETREKHQRREAKGRKERTTGSQPALVHNARRERAGATQSNMSKTAERMLGTAHDSLRRARERVEERPTLSLKLEATRVPAGKSVLQLEDVEVRTDGWSMSFDLALTIVGPERVALVGRSGSGKTTLLRLIAGELGASSGTFTRGVERVAYLDQHVRILHNDESLLDGFRRLNPSIPVGESRIRLSHMKFLREDVFKRVAVLSGGERIRAGLACVLFGESPPQLLMLDEPSNHLDLETIASIEGALRVYEGALIVVSHDQDFLSNVGCTRFLDLDFNHERELR